MNNLYVESKSTEILETSCFLPRLNFVQKETMWSLILYGT